MLSAILSRRGYVKLPPRHAWKVLAESEPADLSEYGLRQLPMWKARRAKVVAAWDAAEQVVGG